MPRHRRCGPRSRAAHDGSPRSGGRPRFWSGAGLDFVIAPVASRLGGFLHPIDDRYLVALYPHVDGETHEWGAYPTRSERYAILDRIVAVDAATDVASGVAIADDFAIPCRDQLEVAVSESSITRMVLTHGEPHRANTIATPEGPVLIDWDTALLAPPERDLWALIDEDSSIADGYARMSGIAVKTDAKQLYRLWWDLSEISLYVAEFRRPHRDTEDVRVAWRGLAEHLDPNRWNDIL